MRNVSADLLDCISAGFFIDQAEWSFYLRESSGKQISNLDDQKFTDQGNHTTESVKGNRLTPALNRLSRDIAIKTLANPPMSLEDLKKGSIPGSTDYNPAADMRPTCVTRGQAITQPTPSRRSRGRRAADQGGTRGSSELFRDILGAHPFPLSWYRSIFKIA